MTQGAIVTLTARQAGDCAAAGSPGRDEVPIFARGTEDSHLHAGALGCRGDRAREHFPPDLGSAFRGERANL